MTMDDRRTATRAMTNALEGEYVVKEPRVDHSELKVPEVATTLLNYQRQIAQAEHEIELMRQMPEMHKQRGVVEARLMLHRRCAQIAEEGFSEFMPPSSWTMGFLSRPFGRETKGPGFLSRGFGAKGDYMLYHRALPLAAMDAYKKAKNSGLFNFFTVHSPDRSAFVMQDHVVTLGERADSAGKSISEFMERLSKIDPVMIGWVNAEILLYRSNYQKIQVMNEKIGNAHSFLIAQWDLVRDLAYDLPMLEAPKE